MPLKLAPARPNAPSSLVAIGDPDLEGIRLSWQYTSRNWDFALFEVYRDGALLGTTIEPSYADATAVADTDYEYVIRTRDRAGYRSAGTAGPVTGRWNGTPTLDQALITSVTSNGTGNTITWDAVASADDYLIMASDMVNAYEGLVELATTASTSYEDTDAPAGTPRWYTVIPRATGGATGRAAWPRVGAKTASVGGAPITVGAVTVTPWRNTIELRVAVTGDADWSAHAALEYRVSGTDAYRPALPLHRIRSATSMFRGAICRCSSATGYDYRITISDPGGVSGSTVLTGSTTTIADTTPTQATTHYVDPVNGSDANAGTSLGAAWATLAKAHLSAPSGAEVDVRPGVHELPTTIRTTPIRYWGTNRVAGENGVDLDVPLAQRSIVVPKVLARPNAVTDPEVTDWQRGHETPWEAVAIDSVRHSGTYNLWLWRNAPVSWGSGNRPVPFYSTHHPLSASRDEPKRLAVWSGSRGTNTHDVGGTIYPDYDGSIAGNAATLVGGKVEFMFVNNTYRYGMIAGPASDGTTAATDLYVRMPADADPNDYYWYIWNYRDDDRGPWVFQGDDSSVVGLEMYCFGLHFMSAVDTYVAQNLGHSTYLKYLSCSEILIEDNALETTGFYKNPPDDTLIPWWGIKKTVGMTADPLGGSMWNVKPFQEAQTDGTVFWLNTGISKATIRRNVVGAWFNGVATVGTLAEIHDNTMTSGGGDDAFEPEGTVGTWAVWNNRIGHWPVGVSTGPARQGPLYLFGNTFYGNEVDGLAPQLMSTNGLKEVSALFFKHSWSSSPPYQVWSVGNIYWSDYTPDPDYNGSDTDPVRGGDNFAGGSGGPEWFWHRNNIMRTANYIWDTSFSNVNYWREDYNSWHTSDTSRGMSTYKTIAAYRTATAGRADGAQGLHSNLDHDFHEVAGADAEFTDAAGGDFSLVALSPWRSRGVRVANLCDDPDVDYSGDVPPLGAYTVVLGSDTVAPDAPTGLAATAQSGSLLLDWDDHAEAGVYYNVYRAATSGGAKTQINTTRVTDSTYTDTTGANGTDYFYTVTAVDVSGNESAYSSEIEAGWADTTPPAAPANLTATPDYGANLLSWDAVADSDLDHYTIYRDAVAVTTTTLTSYTDSRQGDTTEYDYTVTASDAAGNESAASNTASAAALSALLNDRFDGSGALGGSWATSTSGTSTVTQSGDFASIKASGSNGKAQALHTIPDTADVDILIKFKLSNGTFSDWYWHIYLRHDGGGTIGAPANAYEIEQFMNGGDWRITKWTAGVKSTKRTVSAAYTAGALYWMRVQAVGATIRARRWADGEAEPADWPLTYTDPSPIASGTVVGLEARTNSGGSTKTFFVDSILVTEVS